MTELLFLNLIEIFTTAVTIYTMPLEEHIRCGVFRFHITKIPTAQRLVIWLHGITWELTEKENLKLICSYFIINSKWIKLNILSNTIDIPKLILKIL
jgi:hypothetical protein